VLQAHSGGGLRQAVVGAALELVTAAQAYATNCSNFPGAPALLQCAVAHQIPDNPPQRAEQGPVIAGRIWSSAIEQWFSGRR